MISRKSALLNREYCDRMTPEINRTYAALSPSKGETDMRNDRLPAIPLVASDPYFSIWMPSDNIAIANTIYWCGLIKPVRILINVDGKNVSFLGRNRDYEAEQKELIAHPPRPALWARLAAWNWKPSLCPPPPCRMIPT